MKATAQIVGGRGIKSPQSAAKANLPPSKRDATVASSPFVTAQRERLSAMFGAAIQRRTPAILQRKKEEYSSGELDLQKDRKTGEGIPDAPLGPALKFQRFRKLNRIGGALNRQTAQPGLGEIVTGLKSVFNTARTSTTLTSDQVLDTTQVRQKSLATVTSAVDPTITVNHAQYEAYSMLGPLDYWLHNETSTPELEKALRKLRLKMAERSGVSIIAHRGHGPTNRTRGGLIKQDDPRRLNRPAENSRSAFGAALGTVTKNLVAPGLDGIECDVFLSKDLVPILSHEGKVQEQLSTARQLVHNALVTQATEIEDLTAAELKAIQRTDSAESAFITLSDFLDETKDTAKAYFELTGKPLRIEIEMKGHAKETGSVIAEYSEKLRIGVAKIVSKFKKANPLPHWEIILFNNDKDDAKKFGDLRTYKSHLGGVYTGLGSNSPKIGKQANVDELRVSASTPNLKNEKDFIVTYVPGAERPFDSPNSKLGELDFGSRQTSEYAVKVNADMTDETGTEQNRIKGLLDDTKTAKNVHLLTDIPANAAKYKEFQNR